MLWLPFSELAMPLRGAIGDPMAESGLGTADKLAGFVQTRLWRHYNASADDPSLRFMKDVLNGSAWLCISPEKLLAASEGLQSKSRKVAPPSTEDALKTQEESSQLFTDLFLAVTRRWWHRGPPWMFGKPVFSFAEVNSNMAFLTVYFVVIAKIDLIA